MKKVIILVDYRNTFYSSIRNAKTLCTMNVHTICEGLKRKGYQVSVKQLSKIDLKADYNDTIVLYTSSEDYGLFYRSYIEDCVLALQLKGAILVPEFPYFRAHHNKVFMEMLRKILFPANRLSESTYEYGTYEEFKMKKWSNKKYVIKPAYGAGSKGVALARDSANLDKLVRNLSKNTSLPVILRELRKRLLWKGYVKGSIYNKKFIVQDYIQGLAGDYKVLKYGNRFYTLYRKNRINDFRASGGGRLHFDLPKDIGEEELVLFAKMVSDKIHTPLCSMDIAWDKNHFELIEFQCLDFGTYTAEKSDHCYMVKEHNEIERINESCNLEEVFCEAIDEYIKGKLVHE